MVETKVCTKCRERRPLSEKYFSRAPRMLDGFDSWCRECHKAASRAYAKKHPEVVARTSREWNRAHPEVRRAWQRANQPKMRVYQKRLHKKYPGIQSVYTSRYRKQHAVKVRAAERAYLRKHPLFAIWKGLRQRCYNPKNKSFRVYGAAGVQIAECWLGEDGYKNFARYLGPRPSLEHSVGRYLDTGDYEPGNCVWMTGFEQGAERKGRTAMMRLRKYHQNPRSKKFRHDPRQAA